MVRLLIGGSPCTYWSIAQKNNRETKAEGEGWELFKNYLLAKEKFSPDLFLYENNKSASGAIKQQIKKELNVFDGTLFMKDTGARYIEINSALVSAQNRQRFYVHNCGEVGQPKDRGILLKDILDCGIDWKYCNDKNMVGNNIGRRTCVAEPIRVCEIENGGQCYRVYSIDGKSVAQTAKGGGFGAYTGLCAIPAENVGECESIQKAIPKLVEKYGYLPEQFNSYNLAEINEKSPTLSTGSMVTSSCATTKFEKVCDYGIFLDTDNCKNCPLKDNNIYEVKNGLITIKGKQYPIKLADGYYIIRKLTVTECCRLQTMPDDYCRVVSNAQAYKGVGNGWTAEVIIHILNGALKDVPKEEEIVVLSMYDGIGTGRYCLDKMGFTNIKYFAYEIDKYAKRIAMSNYPDIIECGNAFQLRQAAWSLPI